MELELKRIGLEELSEDELLERNGGEIVTAFLFGLLVGAVIGIIAAQYTGRDD